MNKLLVAVSVAALLPSVGFSEEWSYPKQTRLCSGYEVDPVDDVNRFYMGVHADVSFLNWKNKYSTSDGLSGSDTFSFKPLLGADVAVGYKFSNYFRIDSELGYMGRYNADETEIYDYVQKSEFDFDAYTWTVNGYYDFCNGVYVGAGLGAAIVDVSIDSSDAFKASSTNVSPMGALMVGWVHKLDSKIVLDLRYRLAAFDGGDLTNRTVYNTTVKTDMGFMLDNNLSVGIRYSF